MLWAYSSSSSSASRKKKRKKWGHFANQNKKLRTATLTIIVLVVIIVVIFAELIEFTPVGGFVSVSSVERFPESVTTSTKGSFANQHNNNQPWCVLSGGFTEPVKTKFKKIIEVRIPFSTKKNLSWRDRKWKSPLCGNRTESSQFIPYPGDIYFRLVWNFWSHVHIVPCSQSSSAQRCLGVARGNSTAGHCPGSSGHGPSRTSSQ